MTEKPELKPASENPWYVLMTVAGEQTGDWIDDDLHARNRRFWNRWATRALTGEEKLALKTAGLASSDDIERLLPDQERAIAKALKRRCNGAGTPKPGDGMDLSQVQFTEHFVCDGFIFPKAASFEGANFDVAYFRKTSHFETANFKHANFLEKSVFGDAVFYSDALFEGAHFVGHVGFRGATFTGHAEFPEAQFCAGADFSDSKFKSRTVFAGANFSGADVFPPRFYNATLYEDTDWTDVTWPEPPETRDQAIEHRRAYERLKLVMDRQNKFHDEHMFLRKELHCREIEAPRSVASIASRLFRWTSNYGWSIRRPVAGLAVVLGLGWALIFIAEWCDRWFNDADHLGLGQSFALSLSNVFGFLGFGRTFLADEIKTLTAFSEIVSASQTITGLILFFLLGLSLRNRFRMK